MKGTKDADEETNVHSRVNKKKNQSNPTPQQQQQPKSRYGKNFNPLLDDPALKGRMTGITLKRTVKKDFDGLDDPYDFFKAFEDDPSSSDEAEDQNVWAEYDEESDDEVNSMQETQETEPNKNERAKTPSRIAPSTPSKNLRSAMKNTPSAKKTQETQSNNSTETLTTINSLSPKTKRTPIKIPNNQPDYNNTFPSPSRFSSTTSTTTTPKRRVSFSANSRVQGTPSYSPKYQDEQQLDEDEYVAINKDKLSQQEDQEDLISSVDDIDIDTHIGDEHEVITIESPPKRRSARSKAIAERKSENVDVNSDKALVLPKSSTKSKSKTKPVQTPPSSPPSPASVPRKLNFNRDPMEESNLSDPNEEVEETGRKTRKTTRRISTSTQLKKAIPSSKSTKKQKTQIEISDDDNEQNEIKEVKTNNTNNKKPVVQNESEKESEEEILEIRGKDKRGKKQEEIEIGVEEEEGKISNNNKKKGNTKTTKDNTKSTKKSVVTKDSENESEEETKNKTTVTKNQKSQKKGKQQQHQPEEEPEENEIEEKEEVVVQKQGKNNTKAKDLKENGKVTTTTKGKEKAKGKEVQVRSESESEGENVHEVGEEYGYQINETAEKIDNDESDEHFSPLKPRSKRTSKPVSRNQKAEKVDNESDDNSDDDNNGNNDSNESLSPLKPQSKKSTIEAIQPESPQTPPSPIVKKPMKKFIAPQTVEKIPLGKAEGTVITENLRRSTRLKIPPLEFWRCERLTYGRDPETQDKVLKVIKRPPSPDNKLKRKRTTKSEAYSGTPMRDQMSELQFIIDSNPQYVTTSPISGQKKRVVLAHHLHDHEFEALYDNSESVMYAPGFQHGNVNTGLLLLGPGATAYNPIPTDSDGDRDIGSVYLFLRAGRLKYLVGDGSQGSDIDFSNLYGIRSGGELFIPHNEPYVINNPSSSHQCTLYYNRVSLDTKQTTTRTSTPPSSPKTKQKGKQKKK